MLRHEVAWDGGTGGGGGREKGRKRESEEERKGGIEGSHLFLPWGISRAPAPPASSLGTFSPRRT